MNASALSHLGIGHVEGSNPVRRLAAMRAVGTAEPADLALRGASCSGGCRIVIARLQVNRYPDASLSRRRAGLEHSMLRKYIKLFYTKNKISECLDWQSLPRST